MLSRRDVVGRLAAGTAAVCVAGVAGASVRRERHGADASTPAQDAHATAGPANLSIAESGPRVIDAGPPETASARAPWELLQPLAVGSVLGAGWQLTGLTGAANVSWRNAWPSPSIGAVTGDQPSAPLQLAVCSTTK